MLTVPVVVGVLLAACSSDDEDPGTLPDVSPTATSTTAVETPSAQPTHEPTPTADSTAALEAEITKFFEEYIEAVNESWTSKEALKRRREMFADSCRECLAGYEFTMEAHNENLSFIGERIVVKDVSLASFREGVLVFSATRDIPAAKLVNAKGKLVQEFDEHIAAQTIYQAIVNGQDKWVIVRGDSG